MIIKIDVEGQEMDVLKGANQLFLDNRVKAVFIDRYSNLEIPNFLNNHYFRLLNANTLEKFSNNGDQLLAVKKSL